MPKAAISPTQAKDKWLSRIQGAGQQVVDGVNNVTTAPGAKAAAQSQKWLQNTQAAAEKWKARVGSVTLADWQQAMIKTGVPRIAQGAADNAHKFEGFMAEFLPHLQSGLAQIERMPSTTFEDSVQRVVFMMRHNKSFKRSGR